MMVPCARELESVCGGSNHALKILAVVLKLDLIVAMRGSAGKQIFEDGDEVPLITILIPCLHHEARLTTASVRQGSDLLNVCMSQK
jgi:hypothetical protein